MCIRDRNRNKRLGALHEVAALEVRPARLLGRHDLVGLLDERRDEAQGNAHHESQLVHREMDGLQRREQGFQAVCQRDGRRREMCIRDRRPCEESPGTTGQG